MVATWSKVFIMAYNGDIDCLGFQIVSWSKWIHNSPVLASQTKSPKLCVTIPLLSSTVLLPGVSSPVLPARRPALEWGAILRHFTHTGPRWTRAGHLGSHTTKLSIRIQQKAWYFVTFLVSKLGIFWKIQIFKNVGVMWYIESPAIFVNVTFIDPTQSCLTNPV